METFKSKHAIVSKAPYMLYMGFVDMRNFTKFIPEGQNVDVQADYDTIRTKVQGFDIGMRVDERVPYSRVTYKDDGAPFAFSINIHFDAAGGDPDKTDFHIDVEAELNFMMKMLLGSKIKDALNKMVDGLAAASEGRMPEGIDPAMYEQFKTNGGF